MTWFELVDKFCKHEMTHPQYHLVGYITFTDSSFTREYSEKARTYMICSNNKAFLPNTDQYSIYGTSLDRSDSGIRLDWYMEATGVRNGWKIERCWLGEPIMSFVVSLDDDDIIYTFDLLKNHTVKHKRKLPEIARILKCAYNKSPQIASDMWQYIIDVNILHSGVDKNVSFYIFEVYKQLLVLFNDKTIINPNPAVNLLCMNPDRIKLMIVNGEGSKTLERFLLFTTGIIKSGDITLCLKNPTSLYLEMVDLCRLKMHRCGYFISNTSILYRAVEVAKKYINEIKTGSNARNFMCWIVDTIDDDYIEAYTRVSMGLLCESADSLNYLIQLAYKYQFSSQFFDLLWENRKNITQIEYVSAWSSYLKSACAGNHNKIPYGTLGDCIEWKDSKAETPQFSFEQIEFLTSIIQENDTILSYYFYDVNDLGEVLVYNWLLNGDWERFEKYTTQLIMQIQEYNRLYCFEHYFNCYFKSFFDKKNDRLNKYKQPLKIITMDNLEEFKTSLLKILNIVKNSQMYSLLDEYIKEFVEDADRKMRLTQFFNSDDECSDNFNDYIPNQEFKNYIHEFLQSGKIEHENNNKYQELVRNIENDIKKADGDHYIMKCTADVSSVVSKFIINQLVERNAIAKDAANKAFESNDFRPKTYSMSMDAITEAGFNKSYAYAIDDEISGFYFLHTLGEAYEKSQMIVSCIRKRKTNQANKLIDLLIQTTKYPDFSIRGRWGHELKRVALLIIDDLANNTKISPNKNLKYEQAQIANQLIEKIMPHLVDDEDRKLVKKKLVLLQQE